MNEYHKIQTVYKRDIKNGHLLQGQFSLPEFSYLQHNIWVFTEKVDGINIRIFYDGQQVTFGGKTDRAEIPTILVNYLNEKFSKKINLFAKSFNNHEVCLYGEGYGAKIQKGGGNYGKNPDFVLFDVKISNWWLKREDVQDIATKLDYLSIVPIVGEGTLDDMVNMSHNGFDSWWGDFQAEGIVARPKIELKTKNGDRIITKIKYRDLFS